MKKDIELMYDLTIFRPVKSKKAKSKRWHFIHYSLKAKVVVPIILFLQRYMSKYIIKNKRDIPNKPWNKNFRIMWDSFEEAFKDHFFKYSKNKKNAFGFKQFEKVKRGLLGGAHSYGIPKFSLKLLLTIILEDTAYREMLNMFLFRLQKNMNKEYDPKGKHKFPIYSTNYEGNIHFFLLWMKQKGMTHAVIDFKNNKMYGEIRKEVVVDGNDKEGKGDKKSRDEGKSSSAEQERVKRINRLKIKKLRDKATQS